MTGRRVDRGGRVTPIQRKALTALREDTRTAAQLARILWPGSDFYHTTKTAAGVLARLRNEGGLARRTAPSSILYTITRAGQLVLVQDEILCGDAVLLDGRPIYPAREAMGPCEVALVAYEHEPALRHRLRAGRVLRLDPRRVQRMLPALLSAWLDEVS